MKGKYNMYYFIYIGYTNRPTVSLKWLICNINGEESYCVEHLWLLFDYPPQQLSTSCQGHLTCTCELIFIKNKAAKASCGIVNTSAVFIIENGCIESLVSF